jgi:hypothetical protein
MFRKNTPYKRKVIIAVAFLATIVVLVSSPGKKYEADILDKKINTSVPTPEEVLLVSESNSEEDTETPDKTSDKVEAETEEKQEGKTEGKATEQSDKEDNTGTEQAEAEETAQEIKETKTGEAETPELQEEVADPANKENENTTKNQESEAIGGPETEGIADISEPEAQTEEGKKEVVKGNINEEQAAEENTETEKTPEDAEDVETDTTKDDEKEEIGNINDQEVSKRALGGTAGQKAETLETEETNAIEKEEASEKMQKRTDRIQKRLENTDLSPEKRDVLLARLDRLENPQEKIRIKNLKNEIRNMRREAVLEKNLETEMDVKTIAPIRNKIIQARQQKAAPEKEALKNELKREGKARMERLKAINEELERETEEFIAQELPELTEAEKEEVKKVIEPDFVYELMDEPVEETPLFSDDPQLGEQWAVESIINDQLSIVNEWGTDGDSEPVIVAIIDTGVDLSHEDLAGQFWTSESCVDDLGELIEGGCLFGGYDFVDEDTNPMVEDGATHGTAVAGIIGARTDNGVGIASVSKNGVRVMALKVAEDGLLTSESITRAIHFAILNGADIINMSFGGPTPSAVMEGAIAEAEQAGVIVTAAAGNYGLDNDVTPIYPASYDLGNIISVAALDRDDSLASFSDYGVSSVDIAAPGVSVLSTVPGGYQRLSGTSFSAPMVAAVLSVLPLSESNQTVSLIDFLIPKAYAEETQPMTVGEFLNLLFNSVQSLTGLEGKVKGGKVLRFGEGGGQEGGLALQGLKEGVGIDELLDQVVNRSTGLGKTQDFLEEYPGILKDYIDEQGGGSADIDSATSVPSRETIIVMLELKTKAITDPNLTNEQIENVFGISDEEIRQMWFGYSNSPIANPPYGPPGVEWNNFSEEDYQIYLEDTSKFYRQMDYYHRYYNMIISGAWEITDAITFPDGSQITIEQCPVIPIEEKPYDECTRIFALKVMLAKLADSKEQYEHWVSFEEGSFFGIYNKFFGFPNRLFEDSPPLPPPTPLSELELDFLKSAYVKSDSCGIASMFDHQSPDYTENDYTVLFSGRRLNSANNKIGYNSYDGHNGLDVHVRDCSRDGGGSNPLADNGKPLYAAADGIVDEINDKQRDHPYGYYVIIRHDVNGDGFFDFKTRYGHLKTPPVVQENHPIKTGDFIGIAGNTGASTGTHLHFHVSRFFYTGNNPDTDEDINKNESDGSTSSSIIDSFGWWGTEDNLVNGEGEVLDDPWEAQNSDLSSLWLFESGSYVDNESLPTACNDGIDNDGDGKIDYSEDTSGDNGCASRYDDNETSANNEPRHDASNSFFSFNYQSYPWQRQEGSAINGSALYTFGSHEPSMKWSNWSWWTGKVEEARRYEVFVHIPDIQPEFVAKSRIDNIGLTEAQKNAIWEFNRGVLNDGNDNYYENSNYKAAFKIQNRSDLEQLSFWDSLSVQQQNAIYDVWDNRVSTTATYHIFHAKEDGTGLEKHEVTINPEENVGKWVSLGVYNFAKGAHGAVRLIDEVTAENHGKIVWADAVKWEPANGPRLKVTYNGTELSSNNTLSFPQSEIDQTSEISLILRNEGNEPLEISSLNISPLSSPFELVGNSASIQLQPETEMVLSLEFSPDENGFFDAELNILHNAFGGSFVLHLQGYTHFSDVPNNHWAKPYIQYVSDLGVIQGKGDGSFDPNGYATRAEVLKMAYEGKKINTGIQSGSSGFSDIPESEWYYPYVKHAKEAGYVNGASCGTEICFYPNAPISRYEAAKMIHAVFTGTKYNENNSGGIDGKCAGDNSSFYPSNTKIQFSDVGTNDWYCVPVYWMRLTEAEWNGWVFSLFSTKDPIAHGYESGYFAYENASDTEPKNINRAEMAKIIANAMNASGTGPDNIDFQEMTLQSDEEYPESISIGNNYEQIFDETNQNAPDPVHLNPDSTDTKTITASETLTITKETHDADNDELFYFWNATGGTFTTSDETNFHEVTWHPPQVTEDTVFEINVTRGDGRGLIGEGHFEITVTPDDNTPPAPEPLIPTIHSTASGGNWNDAGTWVENQVPTDDDVVEINGTVTVYNDETAAGLKVNSGGQLWNRYNYSRTLTVNGDIENAGSIRNNTAGSRLSINVSGNIINTGAWTNYSTTFTGTDSRVINTEAPITGSVTFGESFELLSSPEFNGSTNFNGKTITLVSGHSITVRNNTTLPVTITGGGGLIFDGGNQNISGTITAENIIFSGSGAKTIYGDSAFNGNLKVSSGIIVWNRYNYSRTLTVNGDIENAGTIRNNSTRYLMVYVSGNITNTGTWTNHRTSLIWKPIPGAQEHQIRIRNASTGEQNTISLGSLSSYNISNFLTTKHLQWWIRQKVGGAWEEWSDVFTITTEKANIPQPGQLFLDVTPDSWEYPFVNHAASRNIISSDADNPGFFRPGDPSTRAEVLKMAYGAVGKVITAACETGQPLPFPDVSNDAWYCDLVKDAEGKGYVTGEGDGLFHPNDAISRAAAVTMLSRVFEIGEEEADCLVQKDLYKSYGDVSPDDESQSWFYTPVYWMSNVFVRTTDGDLDLNMVRNGLLIKGYEDNLFRPERNLLRSEAAKLVVNTKNFFRDPQVQAKKNSKGENCAPVFAALSLQDAEVIPPTVSIGKLYEQITDAEDTTNTAPAPLTLEGGATSATIYANESLPITAPVVDADGDLLFAFWNAIAESGNSAGAFSAEDKVRFTKVIWTPPWVSEETVFTINGTVGDGRGKVGYGTFTITVLPVTSITSVSGGGLWNDAATWNSGQVPGPNDNVIIDSEVVLNTDAIVKTLQITKNGRLIKANEGGPFKMTIIGNLYNDGQLGEPDTGSGENDDGFDLDVKGDLINSDTGSVHNQKNTVSGTVHNDGNYSGGLRTTTLPDVSEIPGDEPFTGTLELKNNFVLEKDLEVPGTVDLGGNVITIPKYETLAVDNLAGSGTIMGDGVLLIRGDIMVSDLVLNVGTLLFDDDDQQVFRSNNRTEHDL